MERPLDTWIAHPMATGHHQFSLFRAETDFPLDVVSISLRVSAHNHVNLYLNGHRVTGLVSPAPSTLPATKLVLAYSLDPRDFRDPDSPERLCLASETLYLGFDGQNYVNGLPAFVAEMELLRSDGSRQRFTTGPDWRCSPDSPFRSGTPAQENRRMTPIVALDARRIERGWKRPGFDDTAWLAAVPAEQEAFAWGQSLQRIPEGVVHERILPVPCGRQEPGWQVFDVGRVVTGFPILAFDAPRGTCIRIRYSEDLLPDGRVGWNVCNERSETYYDECIARGAGEDESFSPDFTYKAFRYLEVTGLPALLRPGALQVAWASTGLRRTARFRCSDPMTDRLFEACMNTQRNNVIGLVADCPHREQAQYLGDAENQFDLLEYAFSDAVPLLEKVLRDFSDAQHADGSFPFVAPCSLDAPEFRNIIPEYDLRFPRLCDRLWRLSGDGAKVAPFLPAARRALGCHVARIDATGLAPRTMHWHISDWPYSHVDESAAHPTVLNLLLHDGCRKMAAMEAGFGEPERADEWMAIAASLAQAIRAHLWNPDAGLFRDGSGSAGHNAAVSALAAECGLVPESEMDDLRDRLASRGLDGSVLLMRPWLHVLFQGRERHRVAAYERMVRADIPGWGRMIRQGSRTIWEGFEDIESHSHAWNAYPARMLLEHVAGIHWDRVGGTLVVEPWLPPGMESLEAEAATPHGPVRVSARRNRDTGRLEVLADLPQGPMNGKGR